LSYHEVLAVAEAADHGGCSRRRAIVTALVAYPIGHAVGVGALSGGAVRLRWYTAAGLSLAEVGQVVVLCTIPYAVGLGVLFSVSLLWRGEIAAALLHVPAGWATGLALAFLLFHIGYVTATFRLRGHWQWPRWLGGLSLKLPSGGLTRMQYLLGVVDVGAAAGILYLFLPSGIGMSYVEFLPLYVLCIFAALASNVPAGLGVFESVLLVMLPHVPPSQLLGAMLLYRCVYEVVPLAWAVFGLALAELAGKGRSPKRNGQRDV
jgi:phosphatidylglycerol lysyltransferase